MTAVPDLAREEINESLDRILQEGTPRLHRSWTALIATGLVAGMEVSVGVLALLVVTEKTGSPLLGALAFSFAFLALLLGHSELFTEGFLVPITVVAAKEARFRDLGRLWIGTALANLAGGWMFMWIGIHALPEVEAKVNESAAHFIDMGFTAKAFALAVVAGTLITLMTRMQNGTDSMPIKALVALFGGFLLAGMEVSHSILESLLAFGALHTNAATFGYLDWLGWLSWAVLGNIVGGVGIVTLLRLVRSRELIAERRRQADPETGEVG